MLRQSSFNATSRPIHRIISGALTAIYLTISLGPLASFAMRAESMAHALTGACAGDCNICGCSAQSRAAHTCCCSRKQQQAELKEGGEGGLPDCCEKMPAERETVIASCGCPCGSGNSLALWGIGRGELLPYYFTAQFVTQPSETRYPELSRVLTSRYPEPPDPPPDMPETPQ